MQKINIFISVTPFHNFIINVLCNADFQADSNYIISSVPYHPDYTGTPLIIPNSFAGKIKGLRRARKFIKDTVRTHGRGVEIFLPHIDGVLGNYVFHSPFLRRHGIKVHFFYEGIALLDATRADREYSRNFGIKFALSFMIGYVFRIHKDILPLEDKRISKIFTPEPALTPGPASKMVKIEFPRSRYHVEKGVCMIMGLNEAPEIEQLNAHVLDFVMGRQDIHKVYFKPHPSDKQNVFERVAEQKAFTYQPITSSYCIEEIISEYNPEFVVCPYLSSGLINLKFMYREEIHVICIINESSIAFSGADNLKFAKDNGIEIISFR